MPQKQCPGYALGKKSKGVNFLRNIIDQTLKILRGISKTRVPSSIRTDEPKI